MNTKDTSVETKHDDNPANRDPITGTSGSHPVGTAVGAAAAGTAGAIVGALGGPVGIVVGSALGVAAGAAVGHNAAETANPTHEDIEPSLKDRFAQRDYARGHQYEDYRDAYAFGAEQRTNASLDARWDNEVETDLRQRWDATPQSHAQLWEDARPAVRDSWEEADGRLRAHHDAARSRS